MHSVQPTIVVLVSSRSCCRSVIPLLRAGRMRFKSVNVEVNETPGALDEPQAANGAQRKSIQSVEVGTRVLEALMASDRVGAHLREVAEKAKLSRSQAHRYLLAYVNTGVVEQDPESGRYGLGPFSVRLGMAALARVEPVQTAGSYLLRLLHELRTTGLLAVWGNYGPTIVRWIDGGIPLYTSLHTGAVLPLQTSSTGILFLTYCPQEQTQAVLELERAAGLSVSDKELDAQVARTRERGYATTFGTVVPGLSAVTTPVLDSDSRLVATMSVLARTQEDDFYSDAKIQRIKQQALDASRAIGYSG